MSVGRLAKSAGIDPDEVLVALLERGVEIDSPETKLEGATWKAARAVIRELQGGPVIVRAKEYEDVESIAPQARSTALSGMLSVEDVLFIHKRLCEDFAASRDPIDPPGLRVMGLGLLESAVNRQHSGYGPLLKYYDPLLNASTLLYGICQDHPFHNGNKRTALVAALAHLDRNRLILQTTRQPELFRLMISVADHSIVKRRVKIGRDTEYVPRRGTPDEEVEAIAAWFRPRVKRITRGETPITYGELAQILTNFGFSLHPMKNRKVDVCKLETRRALGFTKQRRKTLMALEWRGANRKVSIGMIKHIRQTLNLREEDGVPRDVFYGSGVRVDQFINEYRQVLTKLASR